MKSSNYLTFVGLVLLLFSCGENSEKLNSDVKGLQSLKKQLTSEVKLLNDKKETLEFDNDELEAFLEGNEVRYLIKVSFQQVSVSSDIKDNAFNAINGSSLWLEVGKKYYLKCKIGKAVKVDLR